MDVTKIKRVLRQSSAAAVPSRSRHSSIFGLVLCAICLLVMAQNGYALEAVPMARNSFLDLGDDAQSAEKEHRVLMVMFEQEGCVYCEKLRRVNFSDKEIVDRIKRDFFLVQIDIWGEREVIDFAGNAMKEKAFAKRHNVQLTPMTLFFDSNGKVLHKMTGYYKPDKFLASLKFVSERSYQAQSFKEYWHKQGGKKVDYKIVKEPFSIDNADLKAAFNSSSENGKGLVMLFEQDECLECLAMHEGILAQEEAMSLLLDKYDLMQLNVWGKGTIRDVDGSALTESELSDKYGITYTPTLLFIDKTGKERFRVASYRATEHLKLLVEYLSTDAVNEQDSFQEWLRYNHH